METTDIIAPKKVDEFKQAAHSQVILLKKRHEEIKGEMLKIVDASKILELEYAKLNEELYQIEDEYINVMKVLSDE